MAHIITFLIQILKIRGLAYNKVLKRHKRILNLTAFQ